jgi:hypothetical protein
MTERSAAASFADRFARPSYARQMTELRIPGVPEKIDRSRWVAMLAELGLRARDLREFSASAEGIEATVCARDERGNLLIDGNSIATHKVFIRLTG